MSGLYIHVPFCTSRCIYCGFYSTTQLDMRNSYVDAICHEMELRQDEMTSINTIYIGGGTPSVLTGSMLTKIFSYIDYKNAVEITMECNPDDITDGFVDTLRQLPINRVSLGIQTFNDKRLSFLRRRHNSIEIQAAIDRLRNTGITNISIDLMFGFPGQDITDWERDICKAIELNIEHISAYNLMFEEGTTLYNMLKNAELKEIDEETSRSMYELLIERLTSAGYEHYEISNFSKPGHRSIHNSSYWLGTPYVGIGAASHSYNGTSRQWNIDDLNTYISAIKADEVPYEMESLDINTQYNDMVMLRLRTREGIPLDLLEEKFGKEKLKYCLDIAKNYIRQRLIEITSDNHLKLTHNGLFISDMIMSDMMIV